jgi:hypothetical protein
VKHSIHASDCPCYDHGPPKCDVCGEPDCKRPHDCKHCSGDATNQCDRDHLTCDDCAWWTGEGPDSVLRCMACVDEVEAREAYLESMEDR